MINLPKVRYAVLVAAVGAAVTFWPGLTDAFNEGIEVFRNMDIWHS